MDEAVNKEQYSEVDGVQMYCGICEETSVVDIDSIDRETLVVVVNCPLCGIGVQWDLKETY